MEWGPHLKNLAKVKDAPALRNQPSIDPHLGIVLKAVNDLASSRGENGIPFSEIKCYAEHIGVDVFWLADRLMPVDRKVISFHKEKPK